MPLDLLDKDRPDNLINELWALYLEDDSLATRNRLFLYYSPWMKKISTSIFSKYRNPTTEWRDCIQIGSIALLESIGRYDPNIGVPFEGFAYSRLKGAILNTVYRENNFTKNTRSENEEAFDAFEFEDDDSVSFDSLLDSVISAAFSALLDSSAQHSPIFSSDPFDIYSSHSQEEKLANAIAALDKNSSFVIEAHYMNYLKFKDIAVCLDVSTSRVSQLHKEALQKLRSIYEKF